MHISDIRMSGDTLSQLCANKSFPDAVYQGWHVPIVLYQEQK
jgi:hypothetical protein